MLDSLLNGYQENIYQEQAELLEKITLKKQGTTSEIKCKSGEGQVEKTMEQKQEGEAAVELFP